MSIETNLVARLESITANVYPGVAPEGSALPWITWQRLGGASMRWADNTADVRQPLIQVSVWAATLAECTAMSRAVEDALCAANEFQASPQGEPMDTYEPDTLRYGSIQRFEIFGAR